MVLSASLRLGFSSCIFRLLSYFPDRVPRRFVDESLEQIVYPAVRLGRASVFLDLILRNRLDELLRQPPVLEVVGLLSDWSASRSVSVASSQPTAASKRGLKRPLTLAAEHWLLAAVALGHRPTFACRDSRGVNGNQKARQSLRAGSGDPRERKRERAPPIIAPAWRFFRRIAAPRPFGLAAVGWLLAA